MLTLGYRLGLGRKRALHAGYRLGPVVGVRLGEQLVTLWIGIWDTMTREGYRGQVVVRTKWS